MNPFSRPSTRIAPGQFRGLYGIIGPVAGAPGERLAQTVGMADTLLAAGVRVLQLRDKLSDGRELLVAARELRRLTRSVQACFIVNDRLDIALMAEADGVHVGQDDLPVEDVRRVAAQMGRTDLIVGWSTHDADQVRSATRIEVDYIGFGPVFGTTTKPDALTPRGVERLSEAVRLAGSLPVVAIGGVALANARLVHEAGAPMAAVIGDILSARDPLAQASAIHAALS